MNGPLTGWGLVVAIAALVGMVRAGYRLAAAGLAVVIAVSAGLVPALTVHGPAGGPLAPGVPVPAEYREWITRAGSQCPAISPALLAAQLSTESGFNPAARSAVGAQGIAQFMPGTWPSWAVDANGNGIASVWEPADAITAQGRFMCALAARYRGDTARALAAYNAGVGAVDAAGGIPAISETRTYVAQVTALIARYSGPTRR